MKYVNAVPVIATADVSSTLAYYTAVLGFKEHFIFGDPPVYAGVERDGVLLDSFGMGTEELQGHFHDAPRRQQPMQRVTEQAYMQGETNEPRQSLRKYQAVDEHQGGEAAFALLGVPSAASMARSRPA